MSKRLTAITGAVRGSAFLFSVCVILPIILLRHVAATAAGASLGLLV